MLLVGVLSLVCAPMVPCQQEIATQKSRQPARTAKKKVVDEAKEFTLVGAGDIAWCGNLLGAEATAKIIEQIPGTVFAAGRFSLQRRHVGGISKLL